MAELSAKCTATAKTTGERCGQPAIPGGNVCYYHGGNAPQVRAKAIGRLIEARDHALARLIEQVSEPGAPVDAGTLLNIVTKLNRDIELLEGRATERQESAHVEVALVRGSLDAKLDAMRDRVQLAPDVEVIEVEPIEGPEGEGIGEGGA